jgi:AcrR family transcriptional regulator
MGETLNSRGNYAKTAARRREILEASVDVFSSSGFRAGSIREIAETVGISQAGLLHHFTNKSDLLAAVLDFRDDQDRKRLNIHSEPGIDHLRSLAALASYNAGVPGLVQLHCVLSAEATAPEHPAHQYFLDRYKWIVQFATTSFEALQAQHQIIDGVVPASAARALIALMDGLQVQWLLDPTALDMGEEIRQYLRTLLTIEL